MASNYSATNFQTQDYRTQVPPRMYFCACGERATYREYDASTGKSTNVCQACKRARPLPMDGTDYHHEGES